MIKFSLSFHCNYKRIIIDVNYVENPVNNTMVKLNVVILFIVLNAYKNHNFKLISNVLDAILEL